jgi:hypothetical protein
MLAEIAASNFDLFKIGKRQYDGEERRKKKRGYRVCSSGYAATDTS